MTLLGHVLSLVGGTAVWPMVKILVVDDEPDARFLLRYEFERAGHEVTEAVDGRTALAKVAASRPALVVTDMMMPVMSGTELIRRLRADPDTADIPILCISGNCDLATEADATLDKFGNLDDLIPLAQRLIEKGSTPR